MTNRRTKGAGSINPAKNAKGDIVPNKYRVRYSYTSPTTGKRQFESATVTGKRAAEKRLREMEALHADGIDTRGGAVLFRDFAASWQREREQAGEVRKQQAKASAAKIQALNETLGGLALSDITPANVQTALANIRESRSGAGGGSLSNTTLRKYYYVLNMILDEAQRFDLIRKNPCSQIKPPTENESGRRSLSAADAARLKTALDDYINAQVAEYIAKEQRQERWGSINRRGAAFGFAEIAYALAIRTALMSGARRGEVLALTWGDFDEQGAALSIRHTLSPNREMLPPKTKESERVIALDSESAETLTDWKRFICSEWRRLGALPENGSLSASAPIFCTNYGGFISARNLLRWWEEWREAAGFHTLKIHELRHTHATLLLSGGMDVKTVQTRLGHASPDMTLSWYAHAIPENDRRAAERMAQLTA